MPLIERGGASATASDSWLSKPVHQPDGTASGWWYQGRGRL